MDLPNIPNSLSPGTRSLGRASHLVPRIHFAEQEGEQQVYLLKQPDIVGRGEDLAAFKSKTVCKVRAPGLDVYLPLNPRGLQKYLSGEHQAG
jgi:hypothetical protein